MPQITRRRAFWQALSFAGVGLLVLGASACKPVTSPSETSVASVPQGLISDIAIVPTAVDDILNALSSARVVYLGETHTDIADHTAQLEVVTTRSIAARSSVSCDTSTPRTDRRIAPHISSSMIIASG
ncbi:MAG: hypothetical protein AAF152_15780, partial [Cyanobacteria bacterium P01_A01_bin.114]